MRSLRRFRVKIFAVALLITLVPDRMVGFAPVVAHAESLSVWHRNGNPSDYDKDGFYYDGHGCKGDVVIPDNVTKISDGAFMQNTNITSVNVKKGSYAEQYAIDHGINYKVK